MSWIVAVSLVLIAGLVLAVRSRSLRRAFRTRRADARVAPRVQAAALSEAVLTALPPPVRRYVELTGSVGRPPVTEIELRFEATMFAAPGAPGMSGPVMQYERFDTPDRLFFMTTWTRGLPVAVLHDFHRDAATMRVRIAGLFDAVDLDGPALTRTETVTLLNDLCFFAPSRLADPRLAWTPLDDTRARVEFTLGPNIVSAELIFNAVDELVDFISEDRARLQEDGSLQVLRWSTPFTRYGDFGGWRLACEGDAIWHLPEGEFTYGHLYLTDYQAR